MAELAKEVAEAAERAVRMAATRGGPPLDYSEATMAEVEQILAEASQYVGQMSEAEITKLSEDFGCYILEVARRAHGGTYLWYEDREPVLVVGQPTFHVALVTWGKVRGRLSGDEADNIPFFYSGFAERVSKAAPGTRALYV